MNVLLQCPCALGPHHAEASVLLFAEWAGLHMVAVQGIASQILSDTYVTRVRPSAEREYRRRLEVERREAEFHGWAVAEVITCGAGGSLAATVLAAAEPDTCLALVSGYGDYRVVAHRGRFFQYEVADVGLQGEDISIPRPPREPGAYVFEGGRLMGGGVNPGVNLHEELFLLGQWRPAVAEDQRLFGVDLSGLLPPPSTAPVAEAASRIERLDPLKLVAGDLTGRQRQTAYLVRRIAAVLEDHH